MNFSEYELYDGIGLAALVRRKEVSADELLDAAISRVNTYDDNINAVVQNLEPLARNQIKRGLGDGPFTGVPFLLKDCGIDLKGTYTSSGSRFYSRQAVQQSSTLANHYLKAGLVIFGKTNAPEFAISGSTESKALGKCHNPWDLSRGTGGSSGGAAAAVAMAYAPMAHASDGGGSIRNPSSGCGVFGLKPSRSRVVSGPDVYEGVGGMSVQHAITRTVRDSAALLDVSGGQNALPICANHNQMSSFLATIEQPLAPLKIAFHVDAHNAVNISTECKQAVMATVKLCEESGHQVEQLQPDLDGENGLEAASILWKVNAAQELVNHIRTMKREPDPNELEWITQLLAEEGAKISALDYTHAINSTHQIGAKLHSFFSDHDVVLSPVVSQPPWLLDTYENSYSDTQSYFRTVFSYSPFCWPYNMSGQPAMSVPIYWTENNLPIGVQFAGRYGDEATLLQLARQLEVAKPWFNRRPQILITDIPESAPEISAHQLP